MTNSTRLAALFALITSLWVAACAPETPTPDSDEVTGADEETATYVTSLEERHDAEPGSLPTADSIAEEVERFLRDQ